jgi:hypothetical protein
MNASLRKFFWSLPHGLRLGLYKALRPGAYHARRAGILCNPQFEPFSSHRCLYVHVPKCAGMAVLKSLFGDTNGGHATVLDYMLIFSEREYGDYFKFAFVRNPWDRLVSAYHFLQQGGMNEADRRWASKNLSRYSSFDEFVRDWVNQDNVDSYTHFRPQWQFLCRPGTGRPDVDFIGYYERLSRDFHLVCNRLGIDATLMEENRTSHRDRDYKNYYDDVTRAIVGDVYREDLRIFGYDFENSHIGALS